MRHCVATYDGQIRSGERVILSVRRLDGTLADRATLELLRVADGWRLGQFKGVRNQTPSDAASSALAAWTDVARLVLEGRGSRLHDVAPAALLDLEQILDGEWAFDDGAEILDIPF